MASELINKIHCCDNLDLLKSIPSNQINLIYSDILYGTGKNFGEYQDIKPEKAEVFSHYEKRIQEMHRALASNGTIYLQMDLRIVHWIRILMDDVFGYDDFRNQIVVTFNIGGRGKREFAKKHDYIVVYSKSNDFVFNDLDIRVPYKSVVSKSGDRPNITPEKLAIGTIPTNVWDDIPNGMKVKKHTNYPTEKHEKILERIILASSNEGDLVADFYCGSGTTLAVAKRLKRNYLGCDINANAVAISQKRILEN